MKKLNPVGGGDFVDNITYEKLVTRENVMRAWRIFSRGKWRQRSVQKFWLHLEYELAQLYHELANGIYRHGSYTRFILHDTKRREISVASVRDRIVHQILANYLERRFAPHFIAHSYATQKGKGVAAARAYVMNGVKKLLSRGTVYIAKLDVLKYFANIDHQILLELLARRIKDQKILALCANVIHSFGENRGVPLGNLTSQWFANIYLHELDWFAKQKLHIKYYMRYTDDIIILDTDCSQICACVREMVRFVGEHLALSIPDYKKQYVCLPKENIDILGLCTNGFQTTFRLKTVQKAEKHLQQAIHCSSVALFDTMCSYYGSGIANQFQDCYVVG